MVLIFIFLINKKINRDRCRNVDFFKVECAPNIHSVTTWWNIRTGDWLKHCKSYE